MRKLRWRKVRDLHRAVGALDLDQLDSRARALSSMLPQIVMICARVPSALGISEVESLWIPHFITSGPGSKWVPEFQQK